MVDGQGGRIEADDIAAHPDAIELQSAIAAAPGDAAPQLVLADLLLGVDDLRGELIILDNRERADGVIEPAALERYLLLAAEYSFPRIEPEPPTLPFYGFDRGPVRYTMLHAGRQYDIRYRGFVLTIDAAPTIEWRLGLADADRWTPDEATAILCLLSDAIRADTPLAQLRFPFQPDPVPIYDAGPLRGYRLPRGFTRPRGIAPSRYGLAARDYHRWMRLYDRLVEVTRAA